MDSLTPSPLAKTQVLLIPWDPASTKHVERLVQQRIACGWDHEAVAGWKTAQVSGQLNLRWIVLEDSDPEKDAKLLKHTEANPQEREPLVDSAISLGGKPREVPLPRRSFIPVGHICLGPVSKHYQSSGIVRNADGMYWISNFYVSHALQGNGLGTAAMDAVENLATSEPPFAKALGLNAINKDDPGKEEKHRALGLTIPLFSNQEWYERRGYRVFNHVEKLFSKVDSTGKAWYWNAVFLKKEV